MRLAALLLATGCGTSAPTPGPGTTEAAGAALTPACADYAHDAEALAYCHYLAVRDAHDLPAAARLCDAAGAWSAACRGVWVAGRGHQADRDALLAFCADEPCRFDAIDRHLDADLDAQAALCAAHVPTYEQACLDHALIAWSQALPEQAEIERVAARPGIDPQRLGRALAEVVLCAPDRACAGPDAARRACEAIVAQGDAGVCGGAPPAPPGAPPGAGPPQAARP